MADTTKVAPLRRGGIFLGLQELQICYTHPGLSDLFVVGAQKHGEEKEKE